MIGASRGWGVAATEATCVRRAAIILYGRKEHEMKNVLALVALAGLASAASAQYVSMGNLTNGLPQSGSFTPGFVGGQTTPSTWHLWLFQANAGDAITVSVARTAPALDPVSSAFFGNANGAAFPAAGTFILDEAAIMGAIPGLTWVGEGDDNVDDSFGGPFGDPLYNFIAPNSGTYSVFVASFLSSATGVREYDITVTGSTVPTPGAIALLGLGGLAASRRRR
jgi:MYXO-CTERM domain-containing protein